MEYFFCATPVFSLCGEYVFPFRVVFFCPLTTDWIFNIPLIMQEFNQSINQSKGKSFRDQRNGDRLRAVLRPGLRSHHKSSFDVKKRQLLDVKKSTPTCFTFYGGHSTRQSIFILRAVFNEDKFASNFPICPKS